MTDLDIASMPLPLHKPIREWDDLDHAIAARRAGEIAAALSPAPRRIRESRNVYHWPDGSLIQGAFSETYYH